MLSQQEFEQLYLEHRGLILGIAKRHAPKGEEEDIAQLAWLRAWQNLESYDGRAQFSSWVGSIVINACRDSARRLATRNSTSLRDYNAQTSPQQERQQANRDLWGIVDELHPEKKEAICLHFFHGLKYREIGEMLGERGNCIGQRAHRGITELRETLAGQEALYLGAR